MRLKNCMQRKKEEGKRLEEGVNLHVGLSDESTLIGSPSTNSGKGSEEVCHNRTHKKKE